jgi:hypothetical protein
MSSLFHSLTVEGINDELVIESLHKGTIKLSPFRKGYIVVLCQSNKISVPKLYYYGPRKLNVILTQIRCTASFLNHDLHKVHILSSPACSCGVPQENANHFFFCLYQIFWNKKWSVSQHKRFVSIDQYFTSHIRKWKKWGKSMCVCVCVWMLDGVWLVH